MARHGGIECLGEETPSLSRLSHPHIATLHDFDTADGVDFLVMELVRGPSLRDRLVKEGALPESTAVRLGAQLARGLQVAHEQGIVHRDLKPSNLQLTPDGLLKILDFGLARLLPKPASHDETAPTQTAVGPVAGTLPYMSPEQLRGRGVDARTDFYAAGAVLYEMVTGRRPFSKASSAELTEAILNQEPTGPREVNGRISPGLEGVILKALDKDPELRYQTAADLLVDLERLQRRPTAGPAAPEPTESVTALVTAGSEGDSRWRRAAPWIVAAVAGAVALWSLTGETTTPPVPSARFALATPPLAVDRLSSSVTLSPDGRHIAFVAGEEGRPAQLYLRETATLEVRPLPGTENASTPFFSPDGAWVGFFTDSALEKIALRGGQAVRICDVAAGKDADSLGASWGPNDVILFSASGGGSERPIWRVPASGGTPEPLIRPRSEIGEDVAGYPEFLPGGNEVLFTALDGSCEPVRVAVYDLRTGERRNLLEGGGHARYAPTGHLIYTAGDSLLAAPFDLDRLELTGGAVPLVERVAPSRCGSSHLGLSTNGTLVHIPGSGARPGRALVWVDRTGRSEPVVELRRRFSGPRLSPDGGRIAVWIVGETPQVWIYELERGTLTPLTSEGQSFWPVWSPEGDRVVFPSLRSAGAVNIFVKPADGSGLAERLTTNGLSQQPCSWSADGSVIVFHQSFDPGTGWDIGILPLDNRQPRLLLNARHNEFQPALSPDGRWLAFVSDESGVNEVYLTSFPTPGGRWSLAPGGGREPAWAPSGRELFYRKDSKVMVVDVAWDPEPRFSAPRTLFEGNYATAPHYGRNYDVDPEGRRLLMLEEGPAPPAPTELHVTLNWFSELERLAPGD